MLAFRKHLYAILAMFLINNMATTQAQMTIIM